MTIAWTAYIRPIKGDHPQVPQPPQRQAPEEIGPWATPVEAMTAADTWLLGNFVRTEGAVWEEHGSHQYRLTSADTGRPWVFPHPKRRGHWEVVVAAVEVPDHQIRRDAPRPPGITYALITPDGDLEIKTGEWRAELDGDATRIPLHPGPGLVGWVARNAQAQPDRYPRNLVGSVLTRVFGADVWVCAGPVVLTGWQVRDDGGHPASLPTVDDLTQMHTQVRRALGMDPGRCSLPVWLADAVRRAADDATAATVTALPIGGGS
ncbi:hypothetical protein [Thermomonospora cellulosilytica]|uniref:Uncharacterized protein n=1 Tax=Thermomonospora cellulosilytica TaxID=1411118 RepID=A0A7W3N1W8_9ACTN|nr:hypothetical protein [Thermomonospora cellulosilytica]MBA9006011.1 hypothetical protein [Thermomonospora cellulosilytica]